MGSLQFSAIDLISRKWLTTTNDYRLLLTSGRDPAAAAQREALAAGPAGQLSSFNQRGLSLDSAAFEVNLVGLFDF